MPAQVTVDSIEGSKFTQEIRTGEHVLFGDEPVAIGGADKGPTPYDFLLAALGT